MENTESIPQGTYYTGERKIGFALIDLPNNKRASCWLVGDWWVDDDGPAEGWSLMNLKRKYKGVRKIDLSQYLEAKKIQYARGEKTAQELGLFW